MQYKIVAANCLAGLNTETKWDGATLTVANLDLEHRGRHYTNCVQLDYKSETELGLSEFVAEAALKRFVADAATVSELLSALVVRPIDLVVCDVLHGQTKVREQATPRRMRFGMFEVLEAFTGYDPARLAGYCGVVSADGWRLLEVMVQSLPALPGADRQRLSVPLRWFARGNNLLNTTDKLISHWIAFNSLYSDPAASEAEAICNYARTQIPAAIAADFVSKNGDHLSALSSAGLSLGRTRSRIVSAELNQEMALPAPDPIRITEKSLLCIYAVRNCIFHGDWAPDPPVAAKDLIGAAEMALMHLVRLMVLWPFAPHGLIGLSPLKRETFSM